MEELEVFAYFSSFSPLIYFQSFVLCLSKNDVSIIDVKALSSLFAKNRHRIQGAQWTLSFSKTFFGRSPNLALSE